MGHFVQSSNMIKKKVMEDWLQLPRKDLLEVMIACDHLLSKKEIFKSLSPNINMKKCILFDLRKSHSYNSIFKLFF